MRKLRLPLWAVLLLSIFSSHHVVAAPVDVNTARQAAIHFYNTFRPQESKPVEWLEEVMLDALPHLYLFTHGDEGFVLLPADNRIRPVLAYSFHNDFPKQLIEGPRQWLRFYEAQIAAIDGDSVWDNPTARDLWKYLVSTLPPATPLTLENIGPLLQTQWDQTAPFNDLCPYNNSSHELTVVGCTATAMAQVMKYWNHPISGTGSKSYYLYPYGTLSAQFDSTTYRWNDMPNNARYAYTEAQTSALATLSYHCGIAAEMNYGPSSTGGSGAWVLENPHEGSAHQGLVDYFKYSPAMISRNRNSVNSDSTWIALVDNEMTLRHPILYCGYGQDQGGHAFVLDGVDQQGRYHFNWGWSGHADGFFSIDSLTPGSGGVGGNNGYDFSYGQGAIFGIVPLPETFDTVDFYDTTCRTQNEYLFHEYHLPVRNLDTLLPHLTTVYRIHLTVKRSNIVYLDPNGASGRTATQSFCSVDGFTFPECPFSREGYTFKGWNRAEDGSGTLYQPGEWIALSVNPTFFAIWQDTTSSTLTINNTEQGLSVDVFPIPVLTTLQISSHSDIEKVQLFDHLGRCVIVKNGTGNLNIEIDLKNLPTGTYFLYVSSPGGAFKKQIIKQ